MSASAHHVTAVVPPGAGWRRIPPPAPPVPNDEESSNVGGSEEGNPFNSCDSFGSDGSSGNNKLHSYLASSQWSAAMHRIGIAVASRRVRRSSSIAENGVGGGGGEELFVEGIQQQQQHPAPIRALIEQMKSQRRDLIDLGDKVEGEIAMINPESGDTAVHIAVDNNAPAALVRALLLIDPFGPMEGDEGGKKKKMMDSRPDLGVARTQDEEENDGINDGGLVLLASIPNQHGDTALHRTTFNGSDVGIVELVALAHPDAGIAKNKDGVAPLFYACSKEAPMEAMRRLLEGDDDGDGDDLLFDDESSEEEETDSEEEEESDEESDEEEDEEGEDEDEEENIRIGNDLLRAIGSLSSVERQQSHPPPQGSASLQSRPARTAEIILTICPRAIHELDTYLCTPLHTACGEAAPLDCMSLLQRTDPTALMKQNRFGCTPLQTAARSNLSLDVIALLMDTDRGGNPEAAKKPNGLRFVPVHRACQNRADLAVVEAMLRAYPDGPKCRNKRGETPFDLLDGAYADVLSEMSAMQIGGAGGNDQPPVGADEKKGDADLDPEGDTAEWWNRASLLLRASYHGSVDDPLPNGQVFRPVHAAVGVECTRCLVDFVLRMFPGQVKETDETGRMPLHVAAVSGVVHTSAESPPPTGHILEESNPKKQREDIIIDLLRLNPEAARVPDQTGCLPLHLAVQTKAVRGLGKIGVLRALVAAAPECLDIPDGRTGLFPFMAAAVAGTEEDVDNGDCDANQCPVDVYELLRASPMLVSCGVP